MYILSKLYKGTQVIINWENYVADPTVVNLNHWCNHINEIKASFLSICFQHIYSVMSPKIEKKNYRLVKTTQTEHYSLAELYRTLHVPLFIHKLFLRFVFYFHLLFLMYFSYDIVLLFIALVLCLYFCRLCVVTGVNDFSFLHSRIC